MKLIYFLLLAILPSVIFAQTNYHQGYVVKKNGDTLKGFINYREWDKSPLAIDFKVNKDDRQKLEFNPSTIMGFQITGMETYISYIGMITMNPTALSDIPEKLDTTQKLDTIFLEQIATGDHLTLFYHNDRVKTRFFLAETNDHPVELKYYEYYQDDRNVAENNIFRGQILYYINKFNIGNLKLVNAVNRISYAEPDLVSVIDKLNGNNTTSKTTSSNRVFIGLGVNNTITEVYNVDNSGFVQDHTTVLPKISLGIDIFGNPNVQRLVFRTELSLSYVNAHYGFPFAYNATNDGADETYTFKQYTATITPQILFNVYNKDNLKVYLDAGVGFNLSAYGNNRLFIVRNNVIENAPYTLESFWTNFPLQAGIVINKKIEICVTRTGYAAFTKYTGFYASNQTTSLGVKFLFGKN